jgi:hypothetical protein
LVYFSFALNFIGGNKDEKKDSLCVKEIEKPSGRLFSFLRM